MSERFAWIFDKEKQKKIWCADMWSRRRILTIENAGYQTSADVSAAIAAAIGGITELEYLVVSALPASGTKGVIYLVPHSHGTRDIYDEYIWVNNAFEKIGNTDVDLSQYLLKTDIATWAKQPNKPTYTASEVGALPDTTTIPSKTSDLTNDSGFITAGKFAVVDGTLPSAGGFGTEMSYPTGFTSTNCVIISVSAYVFGEWRGGVGIVAASERLWCDLSATGIKPFISANSAFYGATVRVVLMRIDI